MTSQHHPATPEINKDLTTAIKPRLWPAMRPVTLARPDDLRLSTMLAAVVAGTVALVARLGRLSRDVDAHTHEHVKLWAETDDVRTKLVDVGEEFAQTFSSPPRPGGDRR